MQPGARRGEKTVWNFKNSADEPGITHRQLSGRLPDNAGHLVWSRSGGISNKGLVVKIGMPSEAGQHDHCQTCYDRSCNGRLGPCEVVSCELDCGARFHACKRAEHGVLCGNAKQPCLNAGYGCSALVQRSQLGRHLARCPASLVHCTMEWNRWPVCSSERQSHQPVPALTGARRGQLDMALALRDQRMLTRSLRASARTRRILTTGLSRRHPAVPLSGQLTDGRNGGRSSGDGSSGEDFDGQRELERLMEDMHRWENGPDQRRARSPAGLQQSICDQLYRDKSPSAAGRSPVGQQTGGQSQPPPDPGDEHIQKPDFSLGSSEYPYIHCVHCERRKERLELLMESHNAMREKNGSRAQEAKADVAAEEVRTEGGTSQTDTDPDALMKAIKQTLADGDSTPGTHLNVGVADGSAVNEPGGAPVKRCSNASTGSNSSEGSLGDLPPPALFVTPSTASEVSSAPKRGHSQILVVEPPKMTPGSGVASFPGKSLDSSTPASLSLDLSLESITRYQAKPDSMYTFLCAQVFRRDEYASHFRNVHCDIHGGLNGWLEQRCPLAPYGCTYAQRRFFPGQRSARIVHSEQLESFGVRPDGTGCPADEEDEGRGEDGAHSGQPSVPVQMEWVQVKASAQEEPATSNSDAALANSDPERLNSKLTMENGHSSPQPSLRSNETSERDDLVAKSLPKSASDGSPDDPADGAPPSTDAKERRPLEAARRGRGGPASEGALAAGAGPDYLSQLPSELLRYVTRFLDGFSMCNLALTSKLLRQVCCSVLEEKGMVLLQWERRENRWQAAHKVWQFSTAFTPVRHWGFESHPSLAVHLARCPYNVPQEKTEPFRVMP